MSAQPTYRRNVLLLVALLILAGGGAAAYFLLTRQPPLPEPGSPQYDAYLRAFDVGVAALDSSETYDLARQRLTRAIDLVPGEPAGWANRGLLNLRSNELEQAASDLKRAHRLAPDSSHIEALLGFLAEREGRQAEAVKHFEKAVAANPRDLPTLYKLAEAIRQEGKPDSDAEYQKLMEKILKVQPNNLPALLKWAEAAYTAKDMAAFREALERVDRMARSWSPNARKALADVHKAVKNDPGAVAFDLIGLTNILGPESGWSRDFAALQPQQVFMGTPLHHFLRLQQPRPNPAPPDRELAFTQGPWPADNPFTGQNNTVVGLVWGITEEKITALYNESKNENSFGGIRTPASSVLKAAVFVANGKHVRRADRQAPDFAFPGGTKNVPPSRAGLLAIDWNHDFRNDLLLAGAGGLRFWEQQRDGTFKDVTDKTTLPEQVLKGDYYGAWAADIERDGDLDLIVARRTGPPLLLRNNRHGTFKALDIFTTVKDARAFVWADLDNDDAPDAVFLDAAGKLHVFANERHGQFVPWPLPDKIGTFLAATAADVTDDGIFDLVALRADGMLMRLSDEGQRKAWQVAELTSWPGPKDAAPGTVALFAEDLDNNGALDLAVAGPRETHIYLADQPGKFAPLEAAVPLRVLAILDLNRDDRLDLLGLSPEGGLLQGVNNGKKDYRAQVIWPVTNPTKEKGDSRLNSFAIGGAVEIRAGALVQKQPIDRPPVHFGLGQHPGVDVVRIVWPNGAAQMEFELPNDNFLAAQQRLHSSCPYLFTNDGTRIRFAGDFMWGTPLGMYVNGQNIGDFPQTTEWLKVPGDFLKPRNGYYDVRVQANLWEIDYFDELALVVVDHPPDTEIYVDERFFLKPTPPRLFLTTPARPVARAWDHHGKDATDEVRAIDGRYLDRAGRGRVQGITQDHWVEVDLGDNLPQTGPIYLIARGWLQPTNSSINVAIARGDHDTPQPLVLEIPDGKGSWKAAGPPLGFPAGKNKTMLIRLDGIDGKGVSRRVRLRTNMEVYWDFLGYAQGLDEKLARVQRPSMLAAELRYRGILETTRKNASSPEIPRYDKVIRKSQYWRDLTGYYTRFGDVCELLAKVDDRYVIMNAGDEIALRFAVPDEPPTGWRRDFIWECDGWTRDGDPNTRFGTTVLPLPAHGVKTDDRPPGRLEDDPVYRRFPQDWQRYHTRYVTPYEFARGLRNFRRPMSGSR